MTCYDKTEIHLLLDNPPSEEDFAKLLAHVQICSSCRIELERAVVLSKLEEATEQELEIPMPLEYSPNKWPAWIWSPPKRIAAASILIVAMGFALLFSIYPSKQATAREQWLEHVKVQMVAKHEIPEVGERAFESFKKDLESLKTGRNKLLVVDLGPKALPTHNPPTSGFGSDASFAAVLATDYMNPSNRTKSDPSGKKIIQGISPFDVYFETILDVVPDNRPITLSSVDWFIGEDIVIENMPVLDMFYLFENNGPTPIDYNVRCEVTLEYPDGTGASVDAFSVTVRVNPATHN